MLSGAVAVQLVTAVVAAPWHLSYVNPPAGGPDQGIHRLGTSDVDWGQGLAELKRFLDARGQSAVLGQLFAGVPPDQYGLTVLGWKPHPSPPARYLVIGGHLLNLPADRFPELHRFVGCRPAAVVAGCVWVYDTADPEVWAIYQQVAY